MKTSALYDSTTKKVSVAYNTSTESIPLTAVCDYRVGLSAWIPAGDSINVAGDCNPTGATVEIRVAATASSFATTSVKVKVPAQPKAPKVTVASCGSGDGKYVGLKGTKKGMQWSIDNGEHWNTVGETDKDINVATLTKSGEPAATAVWVRLSATDKSPASAIVKLEIPKSEDGNKEVAQTPNLTALKAAVTAAEENIASVVVSVDGTDVAPTAEWVTLAVKEAYQTAIDTAKEITDEANAEAAKTALDEATSIFNAAKVLVTPIETGTAKEETEIVE